ncbi:MAG: hypothetical protein RSH52_12425, partial [Janthinobacterium sp.]
PGKVIPVIFLPGVMGSNLRMSKVRQEELRRPDNRAWRPDDMMGAGGKTAVLTGNGLGGWFKSASPRQRQLVFDPTETEVEYYHYTAIAASIQMVRKPKLQMHGIKMCQTILPQSPL